MYNDLFAKLQNMSIEEIEEQMKRYIFDADEIEAVKSGKETIDNMVKLNGSSSNKVGWYLVLYAIYKLKGGK